MSTENRSESCEERIDGELAYRIEGIGGLFKRANDDTNEDDREEAIEELDNYPLAIDRKRVYTVLISTGGPADWFEATVDNDGDVTRIEYVYRDWYDGARRDLVHGAPEWEVAEQFVRHFIDTDEL